MTQKPQHLTLNWKLANGFTDRFALEVKIDDVLLIDLVRDWEIKHVPDKEKELAGEYAGLFHYYNHCLLGWLNESESITDDTGLHKASLLGCTCGEVGCWPLEADVTINEHTITWSNFLQPHRENTWSYKGFGAFVFERQQYEKEVRQAFATAPE